MSERYFASTPITSEQVTLDGGEAHHLLHVMRSRVGERVTLLDGSGDEFLAEVASLGRAVVELRIVERRSVDRELPFEVTVGVALPKGERQKWLVEKLTELGVSTLVPLVTERGVAQPTAAALDRLRRTVIEAAKQCGRNRLMQIAKSRAWREWACQDPTAHQPTAGGVGSTEIRRLMAHPGGVALAELQLTPPRATQLAIGPEGGFTDAEYSAALAAGWQAVDLGPRVLRVETAAIALASAMALA